MVTIHVPVVHLDLYHSPSIAFAECFEGKSEGFPVEVDIVLDDLGPVDYGEGAVFIGFADGEERITSPKPNFKPLRLSLRTSLLARISSATIVMDCFVLLVEGLVLPTPTTLLVKPLPYAETTSSRLHSQEPRKSWSWILTDLLSRSYTSNLSICRDSNL